MVSNARWRLPLDVSQQIGLSPEPSHRSAQSHWETIRKGHQMAQMITCCDCGIAFHVPDQWLESRRSDKKVFYCPNGHQQAFTQSEADRLRLERDRLKQQLAQKDDEIAWQREQRKIGDRRVIAAKGQITRLKNRAKAGVCPCCNRTFSNMAAHMKTKHPEMDPKVVDLDVEKAKRA
jgi:RNase P subunit RPR2